MKNNTTKSNVEPMDPTIAENKIPVPLRNHQRNAYALVQLVAEVRELFPETFYEFSNYDGRNTALDVTFDCSGEPELAELLRLVSADTRVIEVIEDEGQVLVSLRPGLRTQDSRESFGLDAAWDVLTGGGSDE